MVDNKTIRKEFREWVIRDKLDLHSNFERQYRKLIELLSETTFIWDERCFPFDKNRAIDGIVLREEFFEEMGIRGTFEKSCSVLEMLAAFAIRIEDEYIGNPNHPEYFHIFLEMLDNLGLLKYTDRDFDKEEVECILESWMKHEKWRNVKCVLFPIKRIKVEQLDRDLWSQMQVYLTENY